MLFQRSLTGLLSEQNYSDILQFAVRLEQVIECYSLKWHIKAILNATGHCIAFAMPMLPEFQHLFPVSDLSFSLGKISK